MILLDPIMKWDRKDRAWCVAMLFFMLERKKMKVSIEEAEQILLDYPFLDDQKKLAIFISLFVRIPLYYVV